LNEINSKNNNGSIGAFCAQDLAVTFVLPFVLGGWLFANTVIINSNKLQKIAVNFERSSCLSYASVTKEKR
jgi:hypothetical protein